MRAAMFAAATFASVATGAAQTAAPQAAPARAPMSMDAAGVRLGITSAQVKAALRGTYRCDFTANALTFVQKVEVEVDRRRGRSTFGREGTGVWGAYCKGPNGEDMKVFFAQTPTGDAVDSLSLFLPTRNVSRENLLRQVAARYGRPPFGDARNGCWAAARTDCFVSADGPKFATVDNGTSLTLLAERGGRARRADEAAVQAAADRIAPKKSRAAF